MNKKKDLDLNTKISLCPRLQFFFMTLKLLTKKIKNTSYCMQVQKENFFSVLIFTYLGTDSGHQGTLLRKSQHESKTRNRKKLDSMDYSIKIAFNMYWEEWPAYGNRKSKICKNLERKSLREKCLYSELFRSVFSRIPTEYGPEKLKIRALHAAIYAKISSRRPLFSVTLLTHLMLLVSFYVF